jgi:hypothetical protein
MRVSEKQTQTQARDSQRLTESQRDSSIKTHKREREIHRQKDKIKKKTSGISESHIEM